MEELTNLQRSLLISIAVSYPFSLREIKKVYIRVKSFDTTIAVLDESLARGISWEEAIKREEPIFIQTNELIKRGLF